MAINFDELPSSKPNLLIEKGCYKLKVESADMKTPKDPSKPQYLNIRYSVSDRNGKKLGFIVDIITESEANLARYKLGRFIKALELPLTNFELKDLTKVIVGKELYGDITVEENQQYGSKSIIDALSAEIFYSVAEKENGTSEPEAVFSDEATPFDTDFKDNSNTESSDEY